MWGSNPFTNYQANPYGGPQSFSMGGGGWGQSQNGQFNPGALDFSGGTGYGSGSSGTSPMPSWGGQNQGFMGGGQQLWSGGYPVSGGQDQWGGMLGTGGRQLVPTQMDPGTGWGGNSVMSPNWNVETGQLNPQKPAGWGAGSVPPWANQGGMGGGMGMPPWMQQNPASRGFQPWQQRQTMPYSTQPMQIPNQPAAQAADPNGMNGIYGNVVHNGTFDSANGGIFGPATRSLAGLS